ncbi:DUF2958 domain-containing protein [Variovorax sp. EBFNA2]|uniref:DUF2958 domain-containing protein n=1 Tax=Variovorax sp. EBFNA2 TaxID=3342097 RepID=UPI0029BFC28F|nr:DUF2958 domain-containing protein [Variovorax boronicumulans]WPG41213.1 DUF2958 domain-containing protein [Variovorax boronicumulans]
MTFLTDHQREQMRANGMARARGEDCDPYPVVKLYIPGADATWVLTALDADGDRAFGLMDAGTGFPKVGEVSSMRKGITEAGGLPAVVEANYTPRNPSVRVLKEVGNSDLEG